MIFIILAVVFLFNDWVLLALNLLLIPQIIHNSMRANKVEFFKSYYLLFMATKILFFV